MLKIGKTQRNGSRAGGREGKNRERGKVPKRVEQICWMHFFASLLLFPSFFFLGWRVVRVDELQLIVRSLMVGKTQREKSQKKSKKKRRKPDEAGTYELKISYE